MLSKRDVFAGQSGLVLLGLLSGFGTLFLVLVSTLPSLQGIERLMYMQVLFLLVLWIRKKRQQRRTSSRRPSKSYVNHSSRKSGDLLSGSTNEQERNMRQISEPLQPPNIRFESQDFPRTPGGSGQWVPSTVPNPLQQHKAPTMRRHRTEPHLNEAGRPTSYLPGVRSFTPLALSMPFVSGASTSPRREANEAEVLQRPGMPSLPSSDLLPDQPEGAHNDPFYSSEDLHAESGGGHSASLSYASSTDARAAAHPLKSKYNPRYISHYSHYSSNYPTNQVRPSRPFLANTDGAYRPNGRPKVERSSHLRNRSSGTVMTTSSSATTRIRPVFFNDSPNSSTGSLAVQQRYQPAAPYLEEFGSSGVAGTGAELSAKSRKSKHRLSASHPVACSSARLYPGEHASQNPALRQVSDQSITSLARNFVFPAPPNSASSRSDDTAPRPALRTVPSGRRSSGKLPDSWFGGAAGDDPAAIEGKGKQRMASQHAIVVNAEDENGAAAAEEGPMSPMSPFSDADTEMEVARPESELLATSRAEAQRRETLRSLKGDEGKDDDAVAGPRGLLVQQPSFTSLTSSADVSVSNASHYGQAM